MFAPGTKIVLKSKNVSYIITRDNLNEPEKVEVWVCGRGFTVIKRVEIFADICNNAYVTSVRHNVTSISQLESSVHYAVAEVIERWQEVFNTVMRWTTEAAKKFRKNIILEVLSRVGNDLLVDINKEDVSININNDWYYLQRMITKELAEQLDG